MRKSQKKDVPRSPMPSDYGLPVGAEIIIKEIRESINGESNRIRNIIFGVTIVFSILPFFVLGIINSDSLGDSKFDAFLVLIGIYLFPFVGLFGFVLAEDVFKNKESDLEKKYKDYERDLYSYQKANNQIKYGIPDYEMTIELEEYLDSTERRILNWGLHYSTLEVNTLKLSATQAINRVDKYYDLTPIYLSEEELRFELTNLPYSLGEVSEVLIKAGNAGAEHKIDGSKDVQTLGVAFHLASEQLKLRRGENFQTSSS